MKRLLTIPILVMMAFLMFGCASDANQGNPQAEQAAYDSASAYSSLMVKTSGGKEAISDVSVNFIEAWNADGIECEIYQITENAGTTSWHKTWLWGVANIGNEGWKMIASSEPMETGHKFSRSEIDEFKGYCEDKAATGEIDTIAESTQSDSNDASVSKTPGDSAITAIDEDTVFMNSDNGMTLSLRKLSERSDGVAGYAVSFDDGNVFQVLYDHAEMNNSGEQEDVYQDDGFGIALHYSADTPNRVIITGASSGAQEYAGYYLAE